MLSNQQNIGCWRMLTATIVWSLVVPDIQGPKSLVVKHLKSCGKKKKKKEITDTVQCFHRSNECWLLAHGFSDHIFVAVITHRTECIAPNTLKSYHVLLANVYKKNYCNFNEPKHSSTNFWSLEVPKTIETKRSRNNGTRCFSDQIMFVAKKTYNQRPLYGFWNLGLFRDNKHWSLEVSIYNNWPLNCPW